MVYKRLIADEVREGAKKVELEGGWVAYTRVLKFDDQKDQVMTTAVLHKEKVACMITFMCDVQDYKEENEQILGVIKRLKKAEAAKVKKDETE